MTRKFTFTILAMLFAILGPGAEAWGQTTTYTMQSYSNKVITSDNNATWTTSSACNGSELPYALNSKRGAGFQADNTVTSSISVTNASKITVIASSNGNKTTTLAVKVGNTTFGNTVSVPQQTYQTLEFTAPNNTPVSGTIVFTITRSTKTLWIGQVIVETASTPSTDPTITCANITDVPYEGVTDAEANVTISNADDWTPSVTYDGSIVTAALLNDDNTKVIYSVSENEGDTDREGSFTITLSKDGEEPVSKVVSVTQNHFVVDYATLPFSYDGGKDNLPGGLTQNGLGSDYSSSPKMKFDGTGDYLILKINKNPGTLSFKIKGNGFSGGTFKLQTSADGITYTDKKLYTTLGDTQTETIADLNASVRYIKWIYTKKSSGNVALGDINLTKEGVKIPTFSIEEGNYWASQSVALSQADSKPIYYTTNKDNPTTNGTLYSEAISVTSTCTIKAAAQDGTEWSDVVSATYKIAQTYTTAASVNALTEDNIPVIVSMDNWTIESINGKSMYVNDGTNSLQIYDYYIPENYAVGGKLSGSLKAVWTTEYSGEVKTVQNWDEINYSAPTFAIEIDDEIENGTIEATSTTAPAGTEISFAVNPNDGYRMVANSLIVLDATGDDVDFTGDNPYTFTMPASDVTISAEFELIPATTFSYLYSINGIDNTEVVVAEGSVITLDDGIDIDDNFTFAGWTTDESDVDYILAAGSDYTIDDNVVFYAVYAKEEGGEAVRPTAYTAGDEGNFVIATLVEETYYAIPTNPTVNSGKITGVAIETESVNNVTYVSAENANGYTWTIADATYGQTLYDGNKYLYHSNGGNSGTNLTYGNSTSYTWSIISKTNGLSFQAMNGETVKNRGLLYQMGTANVFGGYSLSNEDSDDYSRIVVLPIATNSGTTHYYTRVFLNETAEANITISGPSIIPAGSTLNMGTYTLANATAANLIIEDGGQLILNEKNTGVMATVKKQIEASNTHTGEPVDKWYTIGSPVKEPIINGSTGNYVADIIPAGGMSALTYNLYYLDMTAGTWINYRQKGDTPGFTTLENGRGYIYSNQSETTVKYVGELNTANVNRSVNTGWNLVSNPFAQTIAFSNFKLDNSASMVGYYSLDGAGGWQAEPITTDVASNTGILVNVPEGASSIEISKPAEAIEKNGAKRGDSNDNAYAYIEINVANANYSDRAYAAFAEGYGLPKYDHINAEIQKVYIPQGGEDFAIAMMDENVTLFPVSFKAMTTGYYTISLKATDDVSTLVLVDNMTGEETNMLLEDSYTFIGSPRDNENRFTVKLKISNSQDEDEHFAYQNGSELVVNGEGTLQIFDILGRVVVSEEVHGQTVNVGGLNTGAYIVRLTGESVKTQKIVVR